MLVCTECARIVCRRLECVRLHVMGWSWGRGSDFWFQFFRVEHMLEAPCPLRSIFGLDKEQWGGVPVSGRRQSRPPWWS